MNHKFLLAQEELRLLERKIALQKGLPHLHGWKFYNWSREFFDSRNHECFISAANQISKSSTQIRKVIHWATATDLWPELWVNQPRQFWYLYPTRDVCHVEWVKKWKPEFMPRGEFEQHPVYGWKAEYYHNRIFAIHFNSGVSVYFKTYGQDVQDLQTGTVSYLALDEETPEELMGELLMRLAATNGYISGVFTPTLGQEYWRQVIEVRGTMERFPSALKLQVSMFDCLQYEDGSKSPWTLEQIHRAINSCKNDAEIQRRVYGKFIVDEGLKYASFSRTKNVKPGHPLPKNWNIFVGADPGSGGENHPAAIAFVAVSPDWKQGRVFRGWRGDGVVTTVSDVVEKVIELSKDLHDRPVQVFYDWASRDFFNIATQMGLQVQPAEKSHVIGEQVVNVLFKNEMLAIYDYPELDPLCVELSNLKSKTAKTKAKDDFCDALRYAVSRIPWDWSAIRSDLPITVKERALTAEARAEQEYLRDRRQFASPTEQAEANTIDQELEAWNELMEFYGE